jgi:hypothetical protein
LVSSDLEKVAGIDTEERFEKAALAESVISIRSGRYIDMQHGARPPVDEVRFPPSLPSAERAVCFSCETVVVCLAIELNSPSIKV